ncbi:MAG: hypothetical protein IPF41_16250 [Flavobacteriales bacterium]|nr:hypothetical protein [Flavobacteriales bacterium]
MLHQPLIYTIGACLLGLLTVAPTMAQVSVDAPVTLSGLPGQRAIEGIAPPTHATSAITVEGSVLSSYMWATGAQTDTIIDLGTVPAVQQYTDGLIVRFLVNAGISGPLGIRIDELPALPLRRPDGLRLASGQLEAGTVAEVLLTDGQFILMSASERGCPEGYTPVNGDYCIETNPPSTTGTWQWAVAKCASRGGSLCTWGEYAAACMMLGSQLGGMHANWEWIDDTSNHTHGADSAGRTTCMSQRTTLITVAAKARCCYHLR